MRDSWKDVDIPIRHSDWNPHILSWEYELLLKWDGLVRGQLDHPEPRGLDRRVLIPAEGWLGWMGLGELLHAFIGLLVQLELEPEGFCNGLICDIIVSLSCVSTILITRT